MDDEQKQYDELIQKAYANASPVVRGYLSSAEFENFLKDLQVRFKIPPDVASAAAHEIFLALLGLTKPQELHAYLEVDAGVPDAAMDGLMAAVVDEVFTPLMEQMGTKEPAESLATPAVVPPPAPINRLSKPAEPATPAAPTQPKPSSSPPIPALAPVTPAVPLPAATLPAPKPFGADLAAPLVKPTAPVVPPLVAEPPLVSVKTRPGEPSAPAAPQSTTLGKKLDPYREAPE